MTICNTKYRNWVQKFQINDLFQNSIYPVISYSKLGLIIILYSKHILSGFAIYFLFGYGINCARNNVQPTAKIQNIDYLINQGKILWDQRIDSLALKKAEHFINLAYQQRQNDFELSVLFSKISFTRAYFFEDKISNQDSLFFQGSVTCKKAVMRHSEFAQIYSMSKGDSVFKLLSAIADAPVSIVPGLYWWGINLGMYLNNQPVLERIKQRELLEVIMHRVISLDPGFYFSGPYRFFGSLYTRIPGVELSQSKTYFDQAITANPEYFGNKVLMAQFYYQKSGNREEFNKTLKTIITADLNKYPEIMADNFFYQKKAKDLLKNEPVLFE